MFDFNEVKRKKHINEDYYLKSKADCIQGIASSSYADMLVENDEYNCGEAHRWSSIADCHLKILMLDFTAGQPISLMSERFEQVIECIEHEAAPAANFNKSAQPSVINLERGLAFWGRIIGAK